MNLTGLLLVLLPMAWLVPNHHLPWMSAWLEGAALIALAGAALTLRDGGALPRWVLVFAALAALSVSGQWATGQLLFGGDAVVTLLYLAAFVMAMAVGAGAAARDASGLDALALGVALAAIATVGISIVQWLGLPLLGQFGNASAPGGRPAGNLMQPNLMCSAVFLGVCAIGLLHERARIGRVTLWASWVFLAAGMAASGSRTAWLQVAVLLGGSLLLRRRVTAGIGPAAVAAWAIVLLALQTLWPAANEALLLAGHRTTAELADPGGRLRYWAQMVDAIALHPFAGYGWQQVVAAQLETALDHPLRHVVFEQSHNLLLEFVLWAGVPVGLGLGMLVAGGFVLGYRRCRDGASLMLMAGATGVLAHAMVEFPLHFAYLLVPVGLFLGAAFGLSGRGGGLRLPVAALRVGGLAFAVVLGIVVRDYFEAEENERVLLLEAARIGTFRIESPPPDLILLTQLRGFLSAARVDPKPGLSAATLDELRRVSTRFAYAPAMSRHAMALFLNGQPQEARLTLQRLCAVHRASRCRATLEAWNEARRLQPGLPALDPADFIPAARPRAPG